jgi:hypothetical protein
LPIKADLDDRTVGWEMMAVRKYIQVMVNPAIREKEVPFEEQD